MTLAIVGMGLVSPFGRSPREHVFFLRAGVPAPTALPFEADEDTPVRVHACPWIDAAVGAAERMTALAEAALDTALAPLRDAALPEPALAIDLARERPGLDANEQRRVVDALARRFSPPDTGQVWGEAGVFTALKDAERQVARDPAAAVAIVAVDSHISLPFMTHHVLHPPTRWESVRPYPSEAAAALVVMSPKLAARQRLPVLGTVHRSAVAVGAANDDNDETVDAAAMTSVLRELGSASVPCAFGQGVVDALRREEWSRAVARCSAQFWDCRHFCIETSIGGVGAAAGAANLVHGVALLRHRAADVPAPADALMAWAISRDGTRGAASVGVEAS